MAQEQSKNGFEIRPEIHRGIAFLDKHKPGWHGHIDLERLDMSSTRWCCLAQLCGGYTEAFNVFPLNRDDDEEIRLGFDLERAIICDEEYKKLTSEWIDAILLKLIGTREGPN